jgi:8-oxo-dGTP pyrophosphatase MutT (NUDIX family)
VSRRSNRPSARVVVVDDAGRVLLFRIVDPLDTKPAVWITPGGGIEAGEEVAEAACRELREETGVDISADLLGAPVAVCRGDWEFRGVPLYSEDWFFALRTPAFEPSDAGWEDLEREIHHSWRWWTPDELDAADEVVFPARLADLVREITAGGPSQQPVELPWQVV